MFFFCFEQINYVLKRLEMMNNAPSPTSSIHQQNDEIINEKKRGKRAMERLKEQAKRGQKKNKTKKQKLGNNKIC